MKITKTLNITSFNRPVIQRYMSKMSCVPNIKLNNGSNMPIIGFGTWQSSDEALETALDSALSAGYRHIDTAFVYQNEHVIGNVLKRWLDAGKVSRDELFIVTKLPNIGMRSTDVTKFIDLSLSKLQLSYLDLYLIHTPFGLHCHDDHSPLPTKSDGTADLDLSTDLEDVWKTMEEQVVKGKTKGIGVSNFNRAQVQRILDVASIPPAVNQVELHLYLQQRELEQFLKTKNIAITGYSSLGTGGTAHLFKALGSSVELPNILGNPMVQKIASEVGKTPAQVLLRHIVQRGISTIPKSTSSERIKQNLSIFDFTLSDKHVAELDSLDSGVRIIDFKAIFKNCESHPEYPF